MPGKGLLERLENNGTVLIAEGYLWELERRGYVQSGSHVPEVVLEHPEIVKYLTEEFVHAGSEVCQAFTYYAHREKLRLVGREKDLEKMNRDALKIARDVSKATGTIFAGGLCNTGVYESGNEDSYREVEAMFKEQVEWAVEEGVEYMIGETFNDYGEAKLALEAIKKYGKGDDVILFSTNCSKLNETGIPAVITMTCYVPDETTDGIPFPKACQMLEEAGADVVGINCGRGPKTMLPMVREMKKVCKGPIAALPVCFRTNADYKTFQSLKDPETGKPVYTANLSCVSCSREDIRKFAKEAKEIGVNYIGLCCGNASVYMRELAEVYGRKPEASKYSPDMSLNYIFGETDKTAKYNSGKLKTYMTGNTN